MRGWGGGGGGACLWDNVQVYRQMARLDVEKKKRGIQIVVKTICQTEKTGRQTDIQTGRQTGRQMEQCTLKLAVCAGDQMCLFFSVFSFFFFPDTKDVPYCVHKF